MNTLLVQWQGSCCGLKESLLMFTSSPLTFCGTQRSRGFLCSVSGVRRRGGSGRTEPLGTPELPGGATISFMQSLLSSWQPLYLLFLPSTSDMDKEHNLLP